MYKFLITLICLLYLPNSVFSSGAFPLTDGNNVVIGKATFYVIKSDETLIELARLYDLGYNEIVDANNEIDPWVPGKGSTVVIPVEWLLPESIDNGIVINLAEMRLYYFFSVDKSNFVKTYPIGIGRQGFNTPTGTYHISFKTKDPVWKPPAASREAHPELPEYVLPGPDNPLGGYWMQMSIDSYGIHGTNRPYGIGRRVSQGCIRLYPEDIEDLYTFASEGTKVKIINEPVKIGSDNGKLFIEIHRSDQSESELIQIAMNILNRKHLLKFINTALLIKSIKSATGLPALISD